MSLKHAVQRQRGRTLIELLVAIALGLLILLGVGGLYLASNQSTRASSEGASIENLGQVALTLIGNSIRRAGFAEIASIESFVLPENVLYPGPHLRACRNAGFVGGDPAAACEAPAAGAPDTIAIWYQADNQLAPSQGEADDCDGNAATPISVPNPILRDSLRARVNVDEIPVARNVFFVAGGGLSCRGGPRPPQPLIAGVEDLKVYFGFDDTPGDAPSARSVRDAAFVNAANGWDNVISVTVCVLMRSTEQGVTAQGAASTYFPCPQTADQAAGLAPIAPVASADGRIRRSFTQTFAVRLRTRPSPLEG
jgi:type IV pilus assembly protein PilW